MSDAAAQHHFSGDISYNTIHYTVDQLERMLLARGSHGSARARGLLTQQPRAREGLEPPHTTGLSVSPTQLATPPDFGLLSLRLFYSS